MKIPVTVDLEIQHEEYGDMFILETENVFFVMGTKLPLEVYVMYYLKRQNVSIEKIKEEMEENFKLIKAQLEHYKY